MVRLVPLSRIRRQAQAFLRENRIHTPPVKVETIARKLGITLRYEPFEDDISGVLYRDRAQTIIGVSSFHHPNRQHFTIAHESGRSGRKRRNRAGQGDCSWLSACPGGPLTLSNCNSYLHLRPRLTSCNTCAHRRSTTKSHVCRIYSPLGEASRPVLQICSAMKLVSSMVFGSAISHSSTSRSWMLFRPINLFRKTFSILPVSFGLVEVDKLVAPQRTVNLDYVRQLVKRYPKSPSLDELLDVTDISIWRAKHMGVGSHLQVLNRGHLAVWRNTDVLGSHMKQLTNEDLEHAVFGGLPAAAVNAFIGYGGAPVNVRQAGPRIVLNNGFHRALHCAALE